MADSRRAAERVMNRMQRLVKAQQRIIFFLLSLILAFMATFFVSINEPEFTLTQQYVLFILVFAVSLWITEAIPPFSVGLLIVGLLIFLLSSVGGIGNDQPGSIDVKVFVDTWSNSVIWLMLGGFFMAHALKTTKLDVDLFKFTILHVGNNAQRVLLGIMGATAIASMVMSNTATTAMMVASTMPLINRLGDNHNLSKALILGIPAAAAIGGMGTIIASPPNAIAIEAINSLTRNHPSNAIGFLEWMVIGVPLAIVLTLILWYVFLRYFKISQQEVDLEFLKVQNPTDAGERFQKRFVLWVMAGTVLLWLTGNFHGIPAAAVSGIPIILLPMVGIVTSDDVRELPWDTLMLVAGGLSLGLAIQESELAQFFVDKLKNFSFNEFVFMLVFAFVTVILSNVMSNTATATILIPVASILPGVDPILMALVIGFSASCALFLPVSTPPNAIAYSTGLVSQKDFRVGGITIGLLGPVFIIAILLLLKIIGYI
ncbi:MAG: DASS family sodium-coupled anion symporter [Flavobacteriaceae bacterium]|nr:DASS family sodium-coupled anion symporter [Flavobacteriaceae bacterium]